MRRSIRCAAAVFIASTSFLGAEAFSQSLDAYEISLEKAVAQAAQNNFAIALERINSKIAQNEQVVARSEFDPVLGASLSSGKSRIANTSAFAVPEIGETNFTKGELSIAGKVTTGAQYSVALEARENKTNSTFEGLNPSYRASLKLEATQPILKGAGFEVAKWRIVTSLNLEDIAVSQLEAKLSDTLTQVHEIYWELLFRMENLVAQREAFARAKDMEKRVRIQVDVGSMAPIDIVQAEAFVASSEEQVITAEHTLDQTADKLLKLINPPGQDKMWKKRLIPSDNPEISLPSPNLEKSFSQAFKKRPEIRAAKKRLENNRIELVYRKNQEWPSLDLVATLNLNGVRGRTRVFTSFDGSGDAESSFGGNWGSVSSDIGSGSFYDYLVGFKLSYPIGSRDAKARSAIAAYKVESGVINLNSLEKDIMLEVREAIRQIENSKKHVNAAKSARILAERKLLAETQKFEVGASTSFNVLEFQKDLTQERTNELRALADARKALAKYHQAVGSTLKYNQIALGSSG